MVEIDVERESSFLRCVKNIMFNEHLLNDKMTG